MNREILLRLLDKIIKDAGNNELMLLPPSPDCCQICGVEHEEAQPHNPQSLYYQFSFNANWGRLATWDDAMAHCSEEVKQQWIAYLNKLGIDPKGQSITGGIKSQAEVEERLKD